MRPALCDEALRLGRMLAELAPDQPEAHGLIALMEIQASRTAARTDAQGVPVLLASQDRTRWDRLLIRRGLAALARAEALGEAPGPYQLQAAIAACHARAARVDETDWAQIATLYGRLAQVAPSPVIELNRAVAVAMRDGPAAGMTLIDALLATGALADYRLAHAARADLCRRLGRFAEARAAYQRALALTRQAAERRFLERRLDELEK
jgi:predicted RNA polymerase sigma factor